jgi:hypothetical protein
MHHRHQFCVAHPRTLSFARSESSKDWMTTCGRLRNSGEVQLIPAVKGLGARHSYGATAADYAVVGEALLWTLVQGLGESLIRKCVRCGPTSPT